MKKVDNPYDLVKITREDLDDLLIDGKYNKANLRQLVRNCLTCLRQVQAASKLHHELMLREKKKVDKIKLLLIGEGD